MKESVVEDKLAFGGLLAISIIALFELMSVDNLSIAQWVALYCFGVCVPALGGSLWILNSIDRYKSELHKWYVDALAAVGSLGAIIGLLSIFSHISWFLAAVFAASGICAFAAWGFYRDALKAEDRNKKAKGL